MQRPSSVDKEVGDDSRFFALPYVHEDYEEAPLVDSSSERISFTARLREAEDFFRRGMCCFYMGFAREVRRMAASGRDLLENPFWQTRLRFTARILTLQVADIEWRHGRNHQKSGHDGKDTMTQMVAA